MDILCEKRIPTESHLRELNLADQKSIYLRTKIHTQYCLTILGGTLCFDFLALTPWISSGLPHQSILVYYKF